MTIYYNPERATWENLSKRAIADNPVVAERVSGIIEKVKTEGDAAIFRLAKEIDSVDLNQLEASSIEIQQACDIVSQSVKTAIQNAFDNIYKFHKEQLPSGVDIYTSEGVRCIQKAIPIEKVGLYIPGGTAPLFSTVLMLAIPAKVSGCKEIILCTPVGKDGRISSEVLYAAQLCGIDKIFKIGGAQAIAAMAYGTESVPKVDKIFGPGNSYVTTAKQMLATKVVAIDMPAGPSEVMVIADNAANPAFVAADLLSQAEHGNDSQVMLLCKSKQFAESVLSAIEDEKSRLSRRGFVENSLVNSRAIVFDNDEEIVDFANYYAPEHLIVSTSNPWNIVDKITAAGSVFVGQYTPESAGDYASGTNHTLPTAGWARSYSGVNIDAYMRKMTIQEITYDGLVGLSKTIVTMAEAEGLQAHAEAVKVRINEQK